MDNLPDDHSLSSREQAIQDVLQAEEIEQAYLARMLHDSVGQNVAALLLGFKGLERELPGQSGAQLTLQSLHAITQNIGQELHRIALELRPTALDDHGLPHALSTVLEEWSVIERVRVDFDAVTLGERRLPPPIETALFRIIRHALDYVAKAPHATHVGVILQRSLGCVTAIIENTGDPLPGNGRKGLTPAEHLRTMEARLSLVGGTLALEPRDPHGVTFFIRLPLASEDTA